jgi:hypothetical protein
MGEDIASWIIFYSVLGLISFFAPWFVHEIKEWLNLFDVIAILVFVVNFLSSVLSLRTDNTAMHICQFTREFLINVGEYSFYLIFANISRSLRFNEISRETGVRILKYFSVALLLLVIGMSIPC